ncbi:MAG: hypothetical protein V7641_1409 [Blastocatellia bacterium]
MLPKNTAICQQFRKCGKAGCKCNVGALHGPYFFHFYREDGKLKKSYIRKADAAELWESYSRWRLVQKQRAADRREFTELCREMRRLDRLLSEMLLTSAKEG